MQVLHIHLTKCWLLEIIIISVLDFLKSCSKTCSLKIQKPPACCLDLHSTYGNRHFETKHNIGIKKLCKLASSHEKLHFFPASLSTHNV